MSWTDANQRYLAASLDAVRDLLVRHGDGLPPSTAPPISDDMAAARAEMGPQSDAAINHLVAVFGLSEFERDVLLLLAGYELDATFAATCRSIVDGGQAMTFSLAMAALPSGHWSALSPAAPLRYWKMVEIGGGDSLATASLRIDERVLHYLTGLDFLDERLHGYLERVEVAVPLAPSQEQVAEKLAQLMAAGDHQRSMLQVAGPDLHASLAAIDAAACRLRLTLYRIRDHDIPTQVGERTLLVRLWEREVALSGRALVVQHDEVPERAIHLADALHSIVLLAGRQHVDGCVRSTTKLTVNRPTPAEQIEIWLSAIPKKARPKRDDVAQVVRHFDLGTEDILHAAAEYCTDPARDVGAAGLWRSAQNQARSAGDSLAIRVPCKATWDDLVLPERTMRTLHQIAEQVRHRNTVYDDWGFADRATRGLGITALFSGRSGTGKTMAAEVLANDLNLDLYRIDLSTVVSKYIGDTEKNLRKVFDAAEKGGSILLFDEADALFGKRSEVKDSHDRFANIEVSYLLQRMEDYRGLAILTSNLKDAIDPAFARRIRFNIDFKFPVTELRERMWAGAFPKATPTFDLKPELLAQLTVAGGNISNVAMNAAFAAAIDGSKVTMAHLAQAARDEFAQMDKTVPETTLKGWT